MTQNHLNALDEIIEDIVTEVIAEFPELANSANDDLTSKTNLDDLPEFVKFLQELSQCYSISEVLRAEQNWMPTRNNSEPKVNSYYGKMRIHELYLVQTEQLSKNEFEAHWHEIVQNEIQ